METQQSSKFLSLILRHKPEIIGIQLDPNGWVLVTELLEKMKVKGYHLTIDQLKFIVETNSKKRFAFSENLERIRANQGHSISVDLNYKKQTPPDILYHGTAEKPLESILESGILKMSRTHVHLSSDTRTASMVGMRHGKVVILEINAKVMSSKGFNFYMSENEVWLTDFVPTEFIKINR